MLIGSKADLEGSEDNYAKLQTELAGEELIKLSSFTRIGLEEIKAAFLRLVENSEQQDGAQAE